MNGVDETGRGSEAWQLLGSGRNCLVVYLLGSFVNRVPASAYLTIRSHKASHLSNFYINIESLVDLLTLATCS